ncbi:hypothetical protein SKAU_G00263750 [Synaphobranchus kaupii]|uniref:Integrase catalytic domain-containing protein n=1 Tax=Synaphobranchus kaupii TaxID=118154 RepID=A0A9Q1EZ74_SYNKA|nr:hypothetical protein SKAU_G00263750 [Synaphobranchus kaupii]
MVERVNRTIKEGIAKQMAQHQNKWTEALPTVLTILRATPSKSTGISPYELMTGRLMKLPIDPEISPADLGPLVVAKQQVVLEQLQERLKVLHAQAALKQQQADLRNDAQFNPNSETQFAEGDMIMVRVFVKQDAFAPRWHGPYEACRSNSMDARCQEGIQGLMHEAGTADFIKSQPEVREMGVAIF